MTAYRNRLNDGHYLVGTVNTEAQPPAVEAEPEPEQERAADHGAAPRLDEMTKAELLEFAKELGVSPANNDMQKSEIRAAVDDFLG